MNKNHFFVYFLIIKLLLLLSISERVSATELAGKIVSIQGEVKIKKINAKTFEPAKTNDDIFIGDVIQTGRASKAALIFLDESQIILNENTYIEVKNVLKSPRLAPAQAKPAAVREGEGESEYNLPKGGAWIRNKNEKFNMKINTPAVTAAIRGTEFLSNVHEDGKSQFVMLEGQVQLKNEFGEVILNPGEEGLVIPGSAPTKRVIVNPEDAVQWTLYYPGYFSFSDIPREYVDSLTGGSSEKEITSLAFRYLRESKAIDAYNLMDNFIKKNRVSAVSYIVFGYSAVLIGKPEVAENAYLKAIELNGYNQVAYSLLAQLYIVQNKKQKALEFAEKAYSQWSNSPIVNFTMALVRISHFKPNEAEHFLKKAIQLDGTYTPPYLYLVKIYIGADKLNLAWKVIEDARKQGGFDGEFLSLAGFVRLGMRDYSGAMEYFNKAIEANPNLGEPHMGLAMCYFRYNQKDKALTSFLTATVLEPRISLYQSSLAKALYDIKSFERSLEVWDYAKELDKNDPTPYFYRGVALTDLNRPAQAIRELNKAIELNNNQGIFKSKLMLDRDEAIRNTSLARAYAMLGLVDWGYSKAVTAQKKDPTNSSAYLFLRDVYLSTRQRTGAATSANWLYYLLSPSNQNSFSSGGVVGSTFATATDYTQMFERPYFRAIGLSEVGKWQNNAQQLGLSANIYGGSPGIAAQTFHSYLNNEEYFNEDANTKSRNHEIALKVDPTYYNSFIFEYFNSDSSLKRPTILYNIKDPPLNFERDLSFNKFNVGYTHRFNPNFIFYSMVTYRELDHDWRDFYRADNLSNIKDLYSITKLNRDMPFNMLNLQAHNQIVWGRHTIISGIDYFDGDEDFNETFTYDVFFRGNLLKNYSIFSKKSFSTPFKTFTAYLQDYYKLSDDIVLEFGASYEWIKKSQLGLREEIYNSHINPYFGASIALNNNHTIRLALQQHLQTHLLENFSLKPPDVAGFPWQLNVDSGALMKQAGIALESQWDENTFTNLRFTIDDISNDLYQLYRNRENKTDLKLVNWKTRRYVAQATLNRILTDELGVNFNLLAKKIDRDLEFAPGTAQNFRSSDFSDYREYQANLNLGYVHPSGWFTYLKNSYVHQDLKYRDDESFFNVNFEVYKEFGRKNAEIGLIINNIFDTDFNYQTEPVGFETFFPSRNIMLRFAILY